MGRMIFTAFALLFFVSTSWAAVMMNSTNQEKVPVTVYYESLCQDSIKFYTKQLYPTWLKLSNYMNLTLVPFGKSTYNKTESNVYIFMCHHGEPECFGNKVQACALKSIPQQMDQVKYINCLMSMMATETNKSIPYPGPQCASSVGIEYRPIEDCAKSDTAGEYLAALGVQTMDLEPKLEHVPTIVFNNKFMMENDELSKTNFRQALCNQFKGMKPEECNANGNNAGFSLTSGFLPILAVTTLLLARL